MELRVLGPVEVSAGDRPVAIGAGKPRALLAMLGLSAGAPVTAERLIDGLWGEEPPPTAPKMVQVYVSQLRKSLAVNADQEPGGDRRAARRRGAHVGAGAEP